MDTTYSDIKYDNQSLYKTSNIKLLALFQYIFVAYNIYKRPSDSTIIMGR